MTIEKADELGRALLNANREAFKLGSCESGVALRDYQHKMALQFVKELFASLERFATLDEIMTLTEILKRWEEIAVAQGDCPLHAAIMAQFPHVVPR